MYAIRSYYEMTVGVNKCREKELQPGDASCVVDLFGQMVVTRSFG